MDIFTRTDLQNLQICDKVTVYFGGWVWYSVFVCNTKVCEGWTLCPKI